MPRVSVIMPVYNTEEEYLRSAIDSILCQTFADFELIIVNDGSTNNAEDVVLSYSDERIKYIKQENKRAAAARNAAWNISSGEYLAIFDSDDFSYPTRLEKQVKFLDENKDISLVGSWVRIIPHDRVVETPADVRIMDLLADCCFFHPSIMLRKSDFDRFGLRYDEKSICTEDYELYSEAVHYLKLANIQEVLVDYRVYSNNSSTKNRDARVTSSFEIQDTLLDYLSADENIRAKILDIAYLNKKKTSTLKEKVFSIKNLYKNWAKYKLVTIFGFEIAVLVRRYK